MNKSARHHHATPGTLTGLRVVVADDHTLLRQSVVQFLERNGAEVVGQAATGDAAVLLAGKLSPDVVVMDVRMPGMDGFEVLRNVKKSNPQVQVIILTGHGGDAEEQTAYRMGAYNFLRKPMDIDELLNSIRMAYRDKLENAMVAVSLAEGGDFDSARDVMNEKDVLEEHGK